MLDLEKDEKDMTKEEKDKLELMKLMALGKGYDIDSPEETYNFKPGSTFYSIASMILNEYDLVPKKKTVKLTPKQEIEKQDGKDVEEKELPKFEDSPEGKKKKQSGK